MTMRPHHRARVTATVLTFCAVMLGPIAGQAASPWVPINNTNRLISWFVIGFSANNPSVRNIGWNLPTQGWGSFVQTKVNPQVTWGVRRVMLHNPFGALSKEDMQFTQYLQAKNVSALSLVTDRNAFVNAWKPITSSGVEVIAYVGSPTVQDKLYAPYIKNPNPTAEQSLQDAAIEPLLSAGMSIAFDAASGQNVNSPTYSLANRLRQKGVRVYIEALPPTYATQWLPYPAMCTTWFWNNPDRKTWGVTETSAGTVILATDSVRKNGTNAAINQIQTLMGSSRDVALGASDISGFISAGVSMSRLLPTK